MSNTECRYDASLIDINSRMLNQNSRETYVKSPELSEAALSVTSHRSDVSSKSNRERLNEERARIAELDAELHFQKEIQEAENRRCLVEEENRRIAIRMNELTMKKEIAKAKARASVYERAESDAVYDSESEKYERREKMLAELEVTKRNAEKKQDVTALSSIAVMSEIRKHWALRDAPAIKVDSFDGDPLNYHYFMSTFEEVVENKIEDPLGRLTRLVQLTTGEAKELIKYCLQEKAEDGYEHAKRLLKEQYGCL